MDDYDFVEDEIVRHSWKGNTDYISYLGLLVRCKDCKHQNWVNAETGCIVCKFGRGTNAPDWFCADGERK